MLFVKHDFLALLWPLVDVLEVSFGAATWLIGWDAQN